MIKDFDPNAAAPEDSGIFGLPFTIENAALILLPVPWEATTSYGAGTAQGPQAILDASKQVDLFDLELGNFYEHGIAMLDISEEIQDLNQVAREAAKIVIHGKTEESLVDDALHRVNTDSVKINHYVYTSTKNLLDQNKLVGIIGGDHASPFGSIQAHLEKYPEMGILHIDAHADLRACFENFEYSHASIMYNVIQKTPLTRLVQVGIRDFCQEEYDFIKVHPDKIITFFDQKLNESKLNGQSWSNLCDRIVENLPKQVYISFDIDGLDPRFCPHTGTPVPGGLDFNEALLLIKKVVSSGRQIIGFDLTEVSPGMDVLSHQKNDTNSSPDPAKEWDANVGARLLYKLCGYTLQTKFINT